MHVGTGAAAGLLVERFWPFTYYHRLTASPDGVAWLLVKWSLLGIPLLIAMKPSGADRWEGDVYNPRDGKTYSSKIAMLPSGKLEIKGCVMGFLCSGENWTRLAQDPPGTAPKTNCAGARR